MLVFLIGFMGAGKTTLGNALAQQLGWRFIDLDHEVMQFSGHSVSELFALKGESGFRQVEQRVLQNVIHPFQDLASGVKNGIIACGGGTPCYAQNLALIKASGFVIYLEASPEILSERLLRTPTTIRPILPPQEPQQQLLFIRNLLDKRRPFYEAAHWKC